MALSIRILACVALLSLAALRAAAQPIIIGAEQGAVFDGLLDGFPQIAPQDGVPDFGGNALGVAFKAGVTEERGVGEYPLAALAGVTPEDIVSATLTFNVDDVLTTFGPGTEFDGSAAEEILVHIFAGNGTVELDDFLAVTRTPHIVDTRSLGPITDASLRGSGPLVFEIDVTDDLRAVLSDGAPAAGVLWRTMDTPTGTSLDNLGDGAAGPPGVNGSLMPYLLIEVGTAATPTPTATAIPTEPTATPSPQPSSTADPNATATATRVPGACAGDCNGDGSVSVSELITGVNIALGNGGVCLAMDGDNDGTVRVAELVRAVGAALNGC